MSTTIGAMAAVRRPKWQYPPTPRMLHLPPRPRRKSSKSLSGKPTSNSMEGRKDRNGKLETLFDQERVFSKTSVPIVLLEAGGECERRRKRVEERENDNGGGGGVGVGIVEEKWRFLAEMLRAECNLLRMEKEIAVRKLERSRDMIEKTLRTAIQTLVFVRQKIQKGNNVEIVHQLAEKLEKLRSNLGVKHSEVQKYYNFDKQATVLQRQLETFRPISDEIGVEEIQEMAVLSLSTKSNSIVSESLVPSEKSNVEMMRRKMEGLSNGLLLERMKEDYGSMLYTTTCSASSSASTSRRIELTDSFSLSEQQFHKEIRSKEKSVCSGKCKVIVGRIVEEVRAETEQWSLMQQMLGKVREEIEELQASRDYWEDRALNNNTNIQSLQSSVQEWRHKALSSESKANELESQIYLLHKEHEKSRKEGKKEGIKGKGSTLIWSYAQNKMEKHVLVCHMKENHQTNENSSSKQKASNNGSRKSKTWNNDLISRNRSLFREIGNSSVFLSQHGYANEPFALIPTFQDKLLGR